MRNAVECTLFHWRADGVGDPAFRRSGTGSGEPSSRRRRSAGRAGHLHLSARLLLGAGCLCPARQIPTSALRTPLVNLAENGGPETGERIACAVLLTVRCRK